MANSIDVQVLEDGPRNFVLKVTGVLDTSDVATQVIITPSMCAQYIPKTFRVDKLDFTVASQLTVFLWWDATPDVLILPMTDFNRFNFCDSGGIQNNSYSPTGGIALSTSGYVSGVQTFAIDLWLVKIGGN